MAEKWVTGDPMAAMMEKFNQLVTDQATKADLVNNKLKVEQIPDIDCGTSSGVVVAIQMLQRTKDSLPVLKDGQMALATDEDHMYFGSNGTNIKLSNLKLGETNKDAYAGDKGKTAYTHSQKTEGNPHNITKNDVSLGNVDNTSDEDKPVSTAQAQAIATATEDFLTSEWAEVLQNMTSEDSPEFKPTPVG